MSIEQNVGVARRWHHDVYLGGRYEVAGEICTPDLVAHGTGVAADAPRGPRFLENDAAQLRAAFRIDELTDDDIIAAGDRVVIRWTFRGAQVAALDGVAPSGDPVTVCGVDVFRLENGRIAEFWGYYNALELMPQLAVGMGVGT